MLYPRVKHFLMTTGAMVDVLVCWSISLKYCSLTYWFDVFTCLLKYWFEVLVWHVDSWCIGLLYPSCVVPLAPVSRMLHPRVKHFLVTTGAMVDVLFCWSIGFIFWFVDALFVDVLFVCWSIGLKYWFDILIVDVLVCYIPVLMFPSRLYPLCYNPEWSTLWWPQVRCLTFVISQFWCALSVCMLYAKPRVKHFFGDHRCDSWRLLLYPSFGVPLASVCYKGLQRVYKRLPPL